MPPTPFLCLPGIFRYLGIGMDVLAASGAHQNYRPFLPSRFCIRLLPPVFISFLRGGMSHFFHISSDSWVLYRRCKKRNLWIRGRDFRQFSEATFSLILYCAVISLRVDLLCLDGTLANFLQGGLAVILYCAVVFLRIDLLCLDRTLANFFEACFSVIVYCAVISLRIDLLCPDRTLAIFYTGNENGMTFSMQKWDMLMSFWMHFGYFEVILGSARPLWNFWGPSGVLLGSKGSQGDSCHHFSHPVLGPFLDLFSQCFHFDVKKCNSNDCKIRCLFPDRFLIDFCTILRSDLEVQNCLKCTK